jgi:hypothetical protein
MALDDYTIDTSGTPQDVQRRQALADALMKQGGDSSPAAGGRYGGVLTALNRGLAGALSGYQRGTAQNEEQQGRSAYQQQLASALQGNNGQVSPQSMITLAGNPWANPAQTQAITHVADMQAQKARQGVEDSHFQQTLALQKEAAARATQSAERANMTPLELAQERAPVLQQYGIDPNSPEGKTYLVTGKLPDTTPSSGYEPNPDFGKVEGASKLRAISGGPNDPATIAADAEAKQGGGMGEGATEILARRLNGGDTGSLVNVGRGAQGSKNLERIQNRAADILMKEEGLSAADAAKRVATNIQSFKASQVGQSAEARTGATREANLNIILKATQAAIPAALEASKELPRSDFVPLNKLIQQGQVMTSDPRLLKFGMSNLQLAEHWARAMNPTGVMRESDRDKALSFLSTAYGNGTYEQGVRQLEKQITRERDATHGSIPETPQFKGAGGVAPATPQAAQADPLGIR